MKISPMPSSGNVAPASVDASGNPQAGQQMHFRAMKMNTNATPEWQRPVAQVDNLPPAPPSSESENQSVDRNQPISPQFAALAKQKRALQVKERELAERERTMSTQPGTESIEMSRLKSDPLKVLLEAGVTYEQLAQAVMATPQNPEINDLKAQLRSMEEGFNKQFSERDAQAEKQVIAEMRREANQMAAEGEDFELIRETNGIPSVMKLIERTFREQGEVLDVKEAMQLVEQELFKEAQRITKAKKVQAQFQTAMPPVQRPQGMRTLTNRDTAQPPISAKQRALQAFWGQLPR